MGDNGMLIMFGFVLLVFVGFYFMMIRPQKNRQKQQNEFVENLKLGEEIVTIGGMYGKIVTVLEKSVVLETENGAEIRFMKGAIAGYADVFEGRESVNEQAPTEDSEQNNTN